MTRLKKRLMRCFLFSANFWVLQAPLFGVESHPRHPGLIQANDSIVWVKERGVKTTRVYLQADSTYYLRLVNNHEPSVVVTQALDSMTVVVSEEIWKDGGGIDYLLLLNDVASARKGTIRRYFPDMSTIEFIKNPEKMLLIIVDADGKQLTVVGSFGDLESVANIFKTAESEENNLNLLPVEEFVRNPRNLISDD